MEEIREDCEMDRGRISVHRSNKYTLVKCSVISNRDLSWSAKGVLVYILSLADSIIPVEFDNIGEGYPGGQDAIETAVKELEAFGYITRDFSPQEDGTSCSVCVSDEPSLK